MDFPRLFSFTLLVGLTLIVADVGGQTNVRDLNDIERKNIERAANLIEDVGKDLSKMADDCEKMLKQAETAGKVPKDVDPAKLREQLKQVHEEEDGWKAMADNIRQLLKDGKIKSGTLKDEKAVTEAGKQIVIDGRYLDSWEFDPDSEFSGLGKFQSLATLCEILVHEKTHYAITIKGEWLLERQFFISLFGDNALEWRPYIAGIHFLASLYKYTERSGGKKKDEKLKLLKGLIDQALKTFADAGGKTGKKFADELRELFKKLGILGLASPRVDQGPDGTLLANVAAEHVVAELGAAGVSGGRDALPVLEQQGTVTIQNVGTGETIGHVVDLQIKNLTERPITCVIPPLVLESRSRKSQDYVCPKPQTAKIDPHGTATVPMDGVCVNRNKPPVGKGVTGDLVVNTGDPNIPPNPDSHIPVNQARDLLRICTSKYDAAEKLQKDGALKDLPYKDKQKQKDIVVQWSTWCDPRISEITGAPPATKEDLRKVVYKQVEEQGPMSPETKKKVDQGIDTIFQKVELTTAKAKDLEKREPAVIGPVIGVPVGTLPPQPSPPAPEATATQAPMPSPTPTPASTPNEQSLKDCVEAAKKKKKECEDEADKRYERCADKCKKDFPIGSKETAEEDFLKRMACLGECAKTKIFDLFVCEAHYSQALEDCIKKHLAEGQK